MSLLSRRFLWSLYVALSASAVSLLGSAAPAGASADPTGACPVGTVALGSQPIRNALTSAPLGIVAMCEVSRNATTHAVFAYVHLDQPATLISYEMLQTNIVPNLMLDQGSVRAANGSGRDDDARVSDAGAGGAAIGSPGVLSGNVVQVPVHVPINVCGNTVNVIGLLNPAFGNTCVNA
jgi:hypothetical protein